MKWILASKSPRRKELLKNVIKEFEIEVSDIDEIYDKVKPDEIVMQLAKLKGSAVFDNHKEDNVCVVSSDTIVAVDDRILGKPVDISDCFSMIRSISGRIHQVYTGVYIIGRVDGKIVSKCFCDATDVYVDELTDQEIYDYIDEGESFDKAGGYAIQGGFSRFINKIDGNYHNVVGFPVEGFYRAVKELNLL